MSNNNAMSSSSSSFDQCKAGLLSSARTASAAQTYRCPNCAKHKPAHDRHFDDVVNFRFGFISNRLATYVIMNSGGSLNGRSALREREDQFRRTTQNPGKMQRVDCVGVRDVAEHDLRLRHRRDAQRRCVCRNRENEKVVTTTNTRYSIR